MFCCISVVGIIGGVFGWRENVVRKIVSIIWQNMRSRGEVSYPVMEIFLSVQGEGLWTGHPAVFVRLAGCDVGCPWCDTKDSWVADRYPRYSVGEIVSAVEERARGGANGRVGIVVVTGGEPTQYDLSPLVEALKGSGWRVHLETAGVFPVRGSFDWVTLSPKPWSEVHPSVYECADELKVVVAVRRDLAFALREGARVSASCLKFVQPEWRVRHRVLPYLVAFVRSHPEWLLSLQTHKYLGLP